MRILNVVGARPNLMKIAPLLSEMSHYPDIEPLLVHTGQHYDKNMSGVFFDELGIPTPDYHLNVGSGSHGWQMAQMILGLEPLFQELKPNGVVVVGDVNSTLAGALVASQLQIPLAHVEAGLRSFDRSMPEEVNRILTDAVADYFFTTEESANENLRREGVAEDKLFFVGSVMIDTLLANREQAIAEMDPLVHGVNPKDYALVTLHRPSNVDSSEVLSGILEAIDFLQEHLPVLFTLHPRTRKQLQRWGLWETVQAMRNVTLLEPLSYRTFVGLMGQARLILSDSSGMQEETTVLGVPSLVLRNNIERPVTVKQGSCRVVGNSPEGIIAAIEDFLQKGAQRGTCPKLWDGKAAQRIVKILHSCFCASSSKIERIVCP